mgnify:FL=1
MCKVTETLESAKKSPHTASSNQIKKMRARSGDQELLVRYSSAKRVPLKKPEALGEQTIKNTKQHQSITRARSPQPQRDVIKQIREILAEKADERHLLNRIRQMVSIERIVEEQ